MAVAESNVGHGRQTRRLTHSLAACRPPSVSHIRDGLTLSFLLRMRRVLAHDRPTANGDWLRLVHLAPHARFSISSHHKGFYLEW